MTFLIRYPHEKEVLFNPLTGLQVKSMSIEGSVVVMSVAPSINLKALTIEEVTNKRCEMIKGLRNSMLIEVQRKKEYANCSLIASDGSLRTHDDL